jgi:DNA-binding CsgD family transcriptional regulator
MRDEDLISSFYGAATGTLPWSEALERTAFAFRSHATLLVIHKPKTMEAISVESHNYPRALLSEFFGSEAYARDPRNVAIGQVRPGTFYFDEALYNVDEMEADPWVRATTDMLQMSSQVGARLQLPHGGEASLCVLRQSRQSHLIAERARAMHWLAPRIEQACALGYLLEEERATQAALLDCLAAKADGVLILDLLCRPWFMNKAAERILAAGDGLALAGAELRCARRPEALALRRLISAAVLPSGDDGPAGGGRLLVSRASRRKPYVVTVMAPPRREAFLTGQRIACVIHIADLAAPPSPNAADLSAVFGLTPREGELAAQLVRATQLDVAAARCAMAVNTARNHLQSIFAKTGTSGQTDLVQMLGRIV